MENKQNKKNLSNPTSILKLYYWDNYIIIV